MLEGKGFEFVNPDSDCQERYRTHLPGLILEVFSGVLLRTRHRNLRASSAKFPEHKMAHRLQVGRILIPHIG
jgi:hypothetical protein